MSTQENGNCLEKSAFRHLLSFIDGIFVLRLESIAFGKMLALVTYTTESLVTRFAVCAVMKSTCCMPSLDFGELLELLTLSNSQKQFLSVRMYFVLVEREEVGLL